MFKLDCCVWILKKFFKTFCCQLLWAKLCPFKIHKGPKTRGWKKPTVGIGKAQQMAFIIVDRGNSQFQLDLSLKWPIIYCKIASDIERGSVTNQSRKEVWLLDILSITTPGPEHTLSIPSDTPTTVLESLDLFTGSEHLHPQTSILKSRSAAPECLCVFFCS